MELTGRDRGTDYCHRHSRLIHAAQGLVRGALKAASGRAYHASPTSSGWRVTRRPA